jgi:tetratricopeptide (TPR) repeat protein
MLAMPGASPRTRSRARVVYCAGVLADIQADLDAAQLKGREARDIYRECGDILGVATATIILAFQAQRRGRYAEAVSRFGETVSLWTQLGDRTAVDLATSNMAHAAKLGGDYDAARRLLQEVVASTQARGDIRGFAGALNGLGDVAATQGDHAAARHYHHDSLAKYREIDDRWGIARVLTDLANVDLQAGDYPQADSSFKEALRAFRELGHQRGVARQLESLAWCATCESRDEQAVALTSAAAAIRQRIAAPPKPAERERIERALAQARGRISAEAYDTAWTEGHSAPLDRLLGTETATSS